MRSRTNIYLDGLIGGYAFGIILNLVFAWWAERHESPGAFWFGVGMLGLYVTLLVRRGKRHRCEDRQVDRLQDRHWHEMLERRVLSWRGENKKHAKNRTDKPVRMRDNTDN